MTKIERLVVFPLIKRDNWVFRCSITNAENIMIMAFKENTSNMMLRYFIDPELAEAWVEECASDKHQDE